MTLQALGGEGPRGAQLRLVTTVSSRGGRILLLLQPELLGAEGSGLWVR